MVFGSNGIDTSKVEESYSLLPDGWYQAQIQEEKEQATSKGGTLLVYTFAIVGKYDGDVFTAAYSGRKIWGSYNVVCPGSEKAEQIAMNEIAKMGKACGLINIRNSSDLLMKTLDIRLGTRQDPGYEPKNEIKGYRSSTSAAPATPAQPTIGQAPAAPVTGSNPPWGAR